MTPVGDLIYMRDLGLRSSKKSYSFVKYEKFNELRGKKSVMENSYKNIFDF